ncbi:CoA ester lyase [Poseidonocella sp. HB161398]|uniref:HpcH/HpaI aldolase/citrate lyase family protein n=1 Tax=Poseidonocella sp. HB161398 TaxID=2320855 RepID=UPI0011094A8E|nr:CoA ester lyase [Poseidonocella sp. HB161398]
MVTLVRAPLFVPATRPDRFARAAESGADAVILDLEDAVAPGDKDRARAQLRFDFTALPVILRINAAGTPWHAADLAAASGAAAVMLPKAEDLAVLGSLAAAGLAVIALVETARGIAAAREIAAHPAVQRLAFGSVDYAADLGCAHQPEPLLAARSELVLASRLAGIAAPLDGVTTALDDPAALAADTARARALGMTGKLCIHPRQIGPVLAGFAPAPSELDWARRVLASGDGAARVDGAMVDEPVRLRARALIAAAEGAAPDPERKTE